MNILPPETRADGVVWETDCSEAEGRWSWLHYDLVHTSAHGSIGAIEMLPEEARELLVGTDEAPRLQAEGQIFFGVLPGLEGMLNEDDFSVSTWRFAATPGLLITARRSPVSALGQIFRSLRAGEIVESPAALVERMITQFAGSVSRELAALALLLDEAEDTLLEKPDAVSGLGTTIGKVRRRATRLKRVMAPLDRIFQDQASELPEWAVEEVYDRARRQIHAAADDLTALQDRARSLQDELSSRQAEQANKRLYLVSIVTALMLPATFVTGFFGMNTGGMFLTDAHAHAGTIAAGVICLMSLAGMYFFLKAKKML